MKLSVNTHLSKEEIIKNGSFFTPNYIVNLVVDQVKDKLSNETVVIDFGVGYGAFASAFLNLPHKRIIATDNDEKSIEFVNKYIDGVDTYLENSLLNINREKYGLNNDELIIIGNPPYNDVTSQYKKGEKGHFEMDEDVSARDLGISFLKMYAKLGPKFICVLHPLSYLIKKTNFSSLGSFKDNYRLVSGIIFSSKHFESIKKNNIEFPVVAALYERQQGGMDFEYIQNFEFNIYLKDVTFTISSYKTIDGIVKKYPSKDKSDDDLQFYTLRDINALKRNKTFLTGHCANGIKITKDNIHYYAWLDLFKHNFTAGDYDFLFGNLSPLITEKIEDNDFKTRLISYVLNENKVVNNYYKNNDPVFFDKYINIDYSKPSLVDEVNNCLIGR